jgi:hypothetical protein
MPNKIQFSDEAKNKFPFISKTMSRLFDGPPHEWQGRLTVTPGDCSASRICPSQKKIDWCKPVAVLSGKGELGDAQVRVLAHGVRRFGDDYPNLSTLVAVTARSHDIVVAVDPETGKGRSLRNGISFEFVNRPETKAAQCFINVYHNGNTDGDNVFEVFDTKAEADSDNILSSRDCLVRLVVEQKPGGKWTVNSEVL